MSLCAIRHWLKLISLGIAHLLDFQHLLASKCLLLAVLNCGGLLEVLAHLELTDYAFLLNHSLETLDSFLKWFSLIDFNVCHITHPLCPSAQESFAIYHYVRTLSTLIRNYFTKYFIPCKGRPSSVSGRYP